MESNWQEHVEDIMTAPSSLEKARAEERLVQSMENMPWTKKRQIVCKATGESPRQMESRRRLLRGSPMSDHLWAEIDANKMDFHGAVEELLRIKSSLIPPSSPEPAAPEPAASPKKRVRASKRDPAPKKRRHKKDLIGPLTVFAAKIVARAEKLLKKRNPLLPEWDASHLMRQLGDDVRSAVTMMSVRADRMERTAASDSMIGEEMSAREAAETVRRSCALLKISRPKNGEPVDLPVARSNMRKIAGGLHPDRNPGNEILYREVINAYGDLERYNEDLIKANVRSPSHQT